MKFYILLLAITACFSLSLVSREYTPIDYTVRIESESVYIPNYSIKLKWRSTTDSLHYTLKKRELNNPVWSTININLYDTSYIDNNVVFGSVYEYRVENKIDSFKTAYGYIAVGDSITEKQSKKLIFLADGTMYKTLQTGIDNYRLSLAADGYKVYFATVPRSEKFDTAKIRITKNIIDSIYLNYGADYILLFGRVPVPYAGDAAVDGHPDHIGAWSADAYYGIISDKWTDSVVDAYSGKELRNHNVPLDGKFDQSTIVDSVRIRVGRVDMYNLKVFSEKESDLLNTYIYKAINYNNNIYKIPNKALIDDRLGTWMEDILATESIMNDNALFEKRNIHYDSLQTALQRDTFMFAYCCSLGLADSLEWVFSSVYFDTTAANSVINTFIGSYMGDWDSKNNILRSIIASEPFALCSYFGGRPFWFLHTMGLGETIGDAYLRSINNDITGYLSNGLYGMQGMHVALLGDPTTRMYRLTPPLNVQFKRIDNKVNISWDYDDNDILGYEVYKSNTDNSEFIKISNDWFGEKFFNYLETDNDTNSIYIVKVVKMQNTPSGSFVNRSIGAFANYLLNVEDDIKSDDKSCNVSINKNTIIANSINNIDLVEVFDIRGNLLYTESINNTHFTKELNNLSRGYLMFRFKIGDNYFSKAFVNL